MKKSDSPDEDKSIHDARLLLPTLKDFFSLHPLINPQTFLGDTAFDAVSLYKQLLTGDTFGDNLHFSKAYLPLNSRSLLKDSDAFINENSVPCCPRNPDLPLKKEGSSTDLFKDGINRQKFNCPYTTWDKCQDGKYRRVCYCENPYTDSMRERMVYIYPEKHLRIIPGTIRGAAEWDSTYKIQAAVEQFINHQKDNLCIAGRRTQNKNITCRSDTGSDHTIDLSTSCR